MLTGKHAPIATARTPPRPGAAHLAVATLAALALATSAAPAGNSIDDAGGHGTQPNSAGGHSTHVRGTTTIVIAAAAAAAAATMAMAMVGENTTLTGALYQIHFTGEDTDFRDFTQALRIHLQAQGCSKPYTLANPNADELAGAERQEAAAPPRES